MTIIKRTDLGRPLTWDELDNNFAQVDSLVGTATAAVSTATTQAQAASGFATTASQASQEAQTAAASAGSAAEAAVAGIYSDFASSDVGKGASLIGIMQPFDGAVSRVQSDKNAELITPADFGAKGDGLTDDTAAFEALEKVKAGVVVDLGNLSYSVGKVFTANKYLNGSFEIAGVLHPSNLDPEAVKYKKHCTEFITGDNTIAGETQIFAGSAGVFQGFCIVPVNDELKLYVTQRATGTDPFIGNFLKGETYRIVEYTFNENGTQIIQTAFSQPLNNIGHATALGYRFENNQLYLYSGYPNESTTDITLAGKGFSKIQWNGSTTTTTDVTLYQMFDMPDTVGGNYANLARADVNVSESGKYLVLLSDDDLRGNSVCLIYLLDEVLAATDPRTVKPLYEFNVTIKFGRVLQGVAINDEHVFVYFDNPVNSSAIEVYDFNGNLSTVMDNLDFVRSLHTYSGYRGGDGVCVTFECENITTFANDIYVGFREIWHALGTIVSYNGAYYTPKAASTGIAPTDRRYWWPVDISTGAAEYNPVTAYTVTGARTRNSKRIFKLSSIKESESLSLHGTGPLNNPPLFDNPRVDYSSEVGNFWWRRWVENTQKWLYTLHISETGNFRFYDTSPESQGNPALMIGCYDTDIGGVKSRFARLRGGDAYGASLFLYAADDASRPGEVLEYVGPNNRVSRNTNQYGETLIKANTTGYVPLRSDVAGTGDFFRGSRYDTVYFGVRTSTVNTIMTSRNGNSFIIGASSSVDGVTDDTTARVNINLTDMAMRPDSNNNLSLGTAAYLWNTVYASTGAINTSDESYKQDITKLSSEEKRVALACAPLIRKFRMIADVQTKGEEARYHFGVIAQEVKAAFEAEGLDGFRYGVLCYDEWEDQYAPVMGVRDEEVQVPVDPENPNGEMKTVTTQVEYATGEKELVLAAGSRYAIRYDELAMFVLAGQNEEISSLAGSLKSTQDAMQDILDRLTALESK